MHYKSLRKDDRQVVVVRLKGVGKLCMCKTNQVSSAMHQITRSVDHHLIIQLAQISSLQSIAVETIQLRAVLGVALLAKGEWYIAVFNHVLDLFSH
jgi:hypothetical protein